MGDTILIDVWNGRPSGRDAEALRDEFQSEVRKGVAGAHRRSADSLNGAAALLGRRAPGFKQPKLHAAPRSLFGPFNALDSDGLRTGARISVWARWFVWLASLIYSIYRPELGPPMTMMIVLGHLALVLGNGSLHYRLWTNKRITWHWLLGLSALDVALTTLGTIAPAGADDVAYLLYYPALALFAVVFSSAAISLAWVTAVAATYIAATLFIGPGLDLEAGEEKALFVRVVIMYAIVACVNLASRFDKERRHHALDRERELLEDRIELSQTIHDTVAQSAYLVSVGIETARDLADETDTGLQQRLDATLRLSQSATWELRHILDGGLIAEGLELSRVLSSHVSSFASITAISAQLVKSGHEPVLPDQVKGSLLAIAHNAMTNVYRHSGADRLTVALDFSADRLRLSITDDGSGLPEDYLDRGHGFRNMLAHAERIGGHLHVESDRSGQGTTVSCLVRLHGHPGAA